MSLLRPGIRRLLQLDTWRKRDATRDMRDEMELHIALRTEQLERDGMSAADARAEARRLFAVSESTIDELHAAALERNRTMRGQQRWDAVWHDLRYATRRLLRDRATTLFIVLTLALGIGINVTAFSIVDRVLLRGPQYVREPDRLVRFYSRVDRPALGPSTMPWMPYSTFTALREGLRSVDGMAAYSIRELMVGSGATSRTRRVMVANSHLFTILGVRPALGRFYGADEDLTNVVVVGERFWKGDLGGDSTIVGKSLAIDDVPHTVIGIAPAGFTGPELGRVDAWIPISQAARNSQNVKIVARLRAGVTIDAAVSDFARLRPQIEATLPKWAGWLRGAHYLAAPIAYDESARESFEAVMARWLAAISAMILLISCANVANLLLARLARRRRELAVRVALGSGRGRVVRLLALEGLLLAAAAAVVSLAVIAFVEPVVQRALFPAGSWAFSLIDARTLGAVGLIAMFTTLLVAVVPAVQAGRAVVSDALRGGNRGGEARSWLRPSLTVVQAMLSVVLLVGAGLFIRSIQRVNSVDLGMTPDRVLTVELRYARTPRLPGESFSDWLDKSARIERERYARVVAVARRVSGVEHAAVSVGVPFYSGFGVGLWVPGRDSVPVLPGGGPYITAVGPGYFATMATPIKRGRAFDERDREGSEAVVIVSETMAATLWPGLEPIGRCLTLFSRDAACARVVGVSADIHRSGLREDPSMQYYVPIGQERGFSGSYLLVRPRGEFTTAWPALREALQRADPGIRSIDVRVLAEGLDEQVRPFELGQIAFGLGAALALVVAALGLYSVMAHAVAWRRHEIGVRMALGARPRDVATMIVGRGTRLATLGVAAGLMITFAARPWVEPRLFETSARDPLVLSGVVILIEMVAVLAGWIPARRAVTVSPTEALRAE
jgi:predicted permease